MLYDALEIAPTEMGPVAMDGATWVEKLKFQTRQFQLQQQQSDTRQVMTSNSGETASAWQVSSGMSVSRSPSRQISESQQGKEDYVVRNGQADTRIDKARSQEGNEAARSLAMVFRKKHQHETEKDKAAKAKKHSHKLSKVDALMLSGYRPRSEYSHVAALGYMPQTYGSAVEKLMAEKKSGKNAHMFGVAGA